MQSHHRDPAGINPLAQSVDVLVEHFSETDRALVAGRPDAVHEHRTAVRRIRSVLAAYGELLDEPGGASLATGMRAWGAALGVARDAEVRAAHVEDALTAVGPAPDDTVGGPQILESGRASAEDALVRLIEVRNSERTAQLRSDAAAFALAVRSATDSDASRHRIRAAIQKESKRTLRRVRDMDGSLDSYHRVRKSARKLRHMVEAVTDDPPGLFGARIRRLGRRAHHVHALLGDHRDAVLLAETLEREAALVRHRGGDATQLAEAATAARDDAKHVLDGFDRARRKLEAAIRDVVRNTSVVGTDLA